MKLAALLAIATAFLSATASPTHKHPKRADCENSGCALYYSDDTCTDGLELGSFKPDCTGACFQFSSFNSVGVAGTIILGVDCVAFSDTNCQSRMGDTGNQHGTHCLVGVTGAQSMQCFQGC